MANCLGRRVDRFASGYERTGVLRYNPESTDYPTSLPWNDLSLRCSDETYSSLRPVLEWTVGNPANAGEEHGVVLGSPPVGPLGNFALQPATLGSKFIPLRIDFGDPTFLNLNHTGAWPSTWIITPENYGDEDWVR